MFWSQHGAENILALRSAIFSSNYGYIWQFNLRQEKRRAA
jgi:hypothetical protein